MSVHKLIPACDIRARCSRDDDVSLTSRLETLLHGHALHTTRPARGEEREWEYVYVRVRMRVRACVF